jgi:hypothetical protein
MMQGGMLLVTAFYNLAASRVGGQPIAPPIMEGQPEALPAPPMSATPPVPADQTLAAFHAYLAPMTAPLLASLNNGETGFEFAEKLSDWAGRNTYDYLRELGPDKLLGIMSTYQPIWGAVSKIPARFTTFLQEFFAYGEADQGDDNGAPQAATQYPPRRVRTVPATGSRPGSTGPRPVTPADYTGAAPVPPQAS